jgi:hypothetical protein
VHGSVCDEDDPSTERGALDSGVEDPVEPVTWARDGDGVGPDDADTCDTVDPEEDPRSPVVSAVGRSALVPVLLPAGEHMK